MGNKLKWGGRRGKRGRGGGAGVSDGTRCVLAAVSGAYIMFGRPSTGRIYCTVYVHSTCILSEKRHTHSANFRFLPDWRYTFLRRVRIPA